MVSDYFKREIELIQDEDLRNFVAYYLNMSTPKYFTKIGASSSGKFHPQFSQNEGGLIRHTKAVVMFAEELLRMSSYAYMRDEYKDYVIIACICHDTVKYGFNEEISKEDYKDHAKNGAENVAQCWKEYFNEECPFVLYNAIRSHMGQWSTDKEDRPFTNVDRCVHLADYIASRPFIDIPQINAEYESVE